MHVPPGSRPANQAAEMKGLRRLEYYAVIYLVVGIVSLGSSIFSSVLFSLPFANVTPGTTPDYAAISDALGRLITFVEVLVPISLVVLAVGLLLLRSGFNSLSEVDRDRFHVPSILILVEIAGLILVGLGVIPIVMALQGIVNQLASNPNGPFPDVANLLFGVILLLPGAALALAGLIGGQILGLWRAGSRYDSALLKVGAILVIIPYLQVVSPILVFLGAREAKGKIPSPAPPVSSAYGSTPAP